MSKTIMLAASLAAAGGGIARIAAGMPFSPRIAFDKPNDQGTPPAVTVEDISKLSKTLGEIDEKVKSFGTEFVKKTEAGEKTSSELKENVDKALSEQGELRKAIEDADARMKEIEQTVAKRGKGGNERPDSEKTVGERFIESEDFKAVQAKGSGNWRGRVGMKVKTITTADFSVEPQRVAGVVALPERRMTVRDLLTPGRTSQNSIQYIRETGFTNNAAVQATEGATKGESDITYELVTRSVATIAHFIVASKQILDDAPMLQSSIDGRLRYGLAYVEEDQLLNGDGTGANLHGIMPQAADYAPAFAPASPQRIDTIRLALLQSELAYFPATGIVLHPTAWARIELTKDNEGRYIFTSPQDQTNPRLWGRPVVATQAMDATEFLVGAFKLGAQIFDREDANVEISTEDNDNFRKNLVTLRGEERVALAVYRPEAFTHGDFGDAS